MRKDFVIGLIACVLALATRTYADTPSRPACSRAIMPEQAECSAVVATDSSGSPLHSPLPQGLSPAQLHKAYEFPDNSKSHSPPIIAIVGAYDAPTIQHDVNYYAKTFGIPQLPKCRGAISQSATPCFSKIDQHGTHHFSDNTSWSIGITTATEISHAICQNCSVLLVEADDNFNKNLLAATDQSVSQKARFISLGWINYAKEVGSLERADDAHFNIPHVVFLTGEGCCDGYSYAWPAGSQWVTAVGATMLDLNGDGSYASETAAGTDSYCSKKEPKPSWQSDSGCQNRMSADLAAVGDLNPGVAMYDSTPDINGNYGWYRVGGTSVSSSIVLGAFALADDDKAEMSSIPYLRYTFENFHDITSGSNAKHCSVDYFCHAGVGYDGPTGLGSPKGIGGF